MRQPIHALSWEALDRAAAFVFKVATQDDCGPKSVGPGVRVVVVSLRMPAVPALHPGYVVLVQGTDQRVLVLTVYQERDDAIRFAARVGEAVLEVVRNDRPRVRGEGPVGEEKLDADALVQMAMETSRVFLAAEARAPRA